MSGLRLGLDIRDFSDKEDLGGCSRKQKFERIRHFIGRLLSKNPDISDSEIFQKCGERFGDSRLGIPISVCVDQVRNPPWSFPRQDPVGFSSCCH